MRCIKCGSSIESGSVLCPDCKGSQSKEKAVVKVLVFKPRVKGVLRRSDNIVPPRTVSLEYDPRLREIGVLIKKLSIAGAVLGLTSAFLLLLSVLGYSSIVNTPLLSEVFTGIAVLLCSLLGATGSVISFTALFSYRGVQRKKVLPIIGLSLSLLPLLLLAGSISYLFAIELINFVSPPPEVYT